MKKHIMLKPLSEEEMYRGIMGVDPSEGHVRYPVRDEYTKKDVVHLSNAARELDFYFDEDTKEFSGRDGEYVAAIFNTKNNVFWRLYNDIYEFSLEPPTIELREGLLGALLQFAWDVDGNMEWEPVVSEVPLLDENGNVVDYIHG